MDEDELEIKRDEMELHNNPANRQGFVDRTNDNHKAILDNYGALGQFKRTLQREAEGHILDVACGNARFADQLLDSKDNIEFVGVDLSEARIRDAKNRLGNRATMIVGDGEYLPFATDSFDTLISSAALHHFPQWDGLALDEITRVLKPGGVMVFREPLKYNPFAYTFRRIAPGPCHTEHESPFDPRELELKLGKRFQDVNLVGHYIAALLFPFFDGMIPVNIPTRLTKSVYDIERKIIDNGGIRLATHCHGVARNPI